MMDLASKIVLVFISNCIYFPFFPPELHFLVSISFIEKHDRRELVRPCSGGCKCQIQTGSQYFLPSVKCVCAVCCGGRPPAADSVGADVGEVRWASESIPVVSEVQRPQESASQRCMGNATGSPTSSTVSDKTHRSASCEATCGLLRQQYWIEPVFSPLPFSHITPSLLILTSEAAHGDGNGPYSCQVISSVASWYFPTSFWYLHIFIAHYCFLMANSDTLFWHPVCFCQTFSAPPGSDGWASRLVIFNSTRMCEF